MKKIVNIDGKTYTVDTDTKEIEEVETPVEETPVKETPVEETPVEETPVEEKPEEVEDKIEKATQEVVSKLGLDKLQTAVDALEKKVAGENTEAKSKVKALLDLSDLMNKDVSELTSKEKIVGFFQAMIQNNESALKALSEGTAADGGYLFPKLNPLGN